MGSTTVRLDEDVYERLKAAKREDESFSDAIDRLLGGGSLLDLVGLWSSAEVDEVRSVLAEVDDAARDDIDEFVGRLDRT